MIYYCDYITEKEDHTVGRKLSYRGIDRRILIEDPLHEGEAIEFVTPYSAIAHVNIAAIKSLLQTMTGDLSIDIKNIWKESDYDIQRSIYNKVTLFCSPSTAIKDFRGCMMDAQLLNFVKLED